MKNNNNKILYLILIIILSIILLNNISINEKFENPKKIIIHKIQNKISNSDAFPPGLGDILKGTFSLYSISKKFDYTFYIDFSNHPISSYLNQTIPEQYKNTQKEVNEYFIWFNIPEHNNLINEVNDKMKNQDVGLFQTNCEPDIIKELDKNDMINIQKLFIPNDYLQEKINNVKRELNLDKYSVLHIRTGDDNINKSLNSRIIQSVEDNLKKINLPENVLLLSDSKELKEYLYQKYKYKILESDIIHLGYLNSDNKEQGIESTLIDFFLICGAEKIYSLSVYDWNSGFSTMASKLYDIPIEKYVI
jgi:hypothetical protein